MYHNLNKTENISQNIFFEVRDQKLLYGEMGTWKKVKHFFYSAI